MGLVRQLEDSLAALEIGWCAATLAMTDDKQICRPDDPRASSWCALGAMAKATNLTDWHGVDRMCNALGEQMTEIERRVVKTPFRSINPTAWDRVAWDRVVRFNNLLGEDATKDLFRRAIRAEKAIEVVEVPAPALHEGVLV
jgi:hypothetical protein